MTWTDSRVFTAAILNPLCRSVNVGGQTSPTGFSDPVATDVMNVALFPTGTTPDRTVAVASSGYNTGVWTSGTELTDTNWAAGGRPLASKTWSMPGGNTYAMFDAADTAGAGNVTLAGVFGCLVYDNSITAGTVAKQGFCYNYFGGSQGVTAGTFTIIWDATGVFKFTT